MKSINFKFKYIFKKCYVKVMENNKLGMTSVFQYIDTDTIDTFYTSAVHTCIQLVLEFINTVCFIKNYIFITEGYQFNFNNTK